MSGFSVRKPSDPELALCSETERAVLPGTAWSEDAIKQTLGTGNGGYFAAFTGDSIVGTVSFAVTEYDCEILNLCVLPEFRRKGVASALVAAAEAEAAKAGAGSVCLEVAADNLSAIAFYKSAGYEKAGTRKGFYKGVDGETYVKKLRIQD